MKFLDNLPELELLSSALSYASPSLRVTTRIEAYSCKPVSRERKLYKALEQDLVSDLEFNISGSPPDQHDAQVGSAFGPLDKRESRKTLYHLIGTLNQAFPDFDFSSVRADEFTREPSARSVLASLSTALNHLRASAATTSNTNSVYRSFSSFSAGGSGTPQAVDHFPVEVSGSYDMPTHPFLRQILDPIVDLSECEVYSYAPDIDSDPHAVESERGSVAPSEIGDEASSRQESEDGGQWQMDGFESVASSSVPPSPTTTRRLRSGKSYFTTTGPNQSTFTNRFARGGRTPFSERSRSNTPSVLDHDAGASSGLLWSCNYFFYNKTKKRILFISHNMRRVTAQSADRSLPLSAYAHARLSDDNLYNSPFTRTRSRTTSSGVPLFGIAADGRSVQQIK